MKEQKCKELIKKDLQSAVVVCNDLISEIDTADLVDVDMKLDRIIRHLDHTKIHLKGCEDY